MILGWLSKVIWKQTLDYSRLDESVKESRVKSESFRLSMGDGPWQPSRTTCGKDQLRVFLMKRFPQAKTDSLMWFASRSLAYTLTHIHTHKH